MTIAQCIVAYSVCWWLVLFMLLPNGAAPEKKPTLGHAPSAPANPRLGHKFRWATLLAILPTLLIYFVATNAKAADDERIYHVGSSGCKPLATYTATAPDDVSTRDGYGVGEHKVASANLESSTILRDMDHVDIPLNIPSKKYLNADKYNADLSESNAALGTLRVGRDGSVLLNEQSVAQQNTYTSDCSGAEQ